MAGNILDSNACSFQKLDLDQLCPTMKQKNDAGVFEHKNAVCKAGEYQQEGSHVIQSAVEMNLSNE